MANSKLSSSNQPLKDRPNKSQIKRDIAEIQHIAQQLIDLSDGAIQKIPLDDELKEAVALARRIRNTREGYRRQLQLVTKLLRGQDYSSVADALASLKRSGDEENARFHALERWRDRILNDGDDGIQAFLEQYPQADRQKLRALVRKTHKEQTEDKPPVAFRELFKYLRSVAAS